MDISDALNLQIGDNSSLLRSIPSTEVGFFIKYLSDLPVEKKAVFLGDCARLGELHFETGGYALSEASSLDVYREARAQRAMYGTEFMGVSQKLGLAKLEANFSKDEKMGLSEVELCDWTVLKPAKGTDIKRALKKQCKERGYRSVKAKCEGVDVLMNDGVVLNVDVASKNTQLKYGVCVNGSSLLLTFEGILGVGLGWWDNISVETVDESIVALFEVGLAVKALCSSSNCN